MADHSVPYFRVHGITQGGNDREQDKEEDIEDEEDDGYDAKPVAIVGELM